MNQPTTCTSRFCFNNKRYSLEHYSDAVSLQVVREVMDGTSYPIYPFPKGRIRKILDLGAHIGAATLYFHCHYPSAQITSLEPHPAYAKILRRNLAANQVQAEFLEAAYAIRNRKVFVANGKHGPCSSYVTSVHVRRAIQVPTIHPTDLELQTYDLVKIDIEGDEDAIFSHLPHKPWGNVAMIYVEYHQANTRHVIDDALRSTHVLAHARIYHPSTGELAYVLKSYVE